MYKKILSLVLFVSILGFVSADSSGMKSVDVKFDGSKIAESTAGLNQIEVDFCEVPGEKRIGYYLDEGVSKKVCIQITNKTAYLQKVNIGFVDAIITNDDFKNPACQENNQKSMFSDYVTGYQQSILLTGLSVTKIYPTIAYPKGGTGTSSGCVVYYLEPTPMGGAVAFSVLMRRAKFIDLYVTRVVKNNMNYNYILISGLVLFGIGLYMKRRRNKK